MIFLPGFQILQNGKEELSSTRCTNAISIIASLPAKRSCGSDNISNILLKEIAPILCEPLSIITNQSMHTGIFPDLSKLAEVVPVFTSTNVVKAVCNVMLMPTAYIDLT